MTTRILRLPEVLLTTGLSRSTLYARVATGDFPPSIKLGPRAVGWRSGDVEAWVESRPLARPKPDEAA